MLRNKIVSKLEKDGFILCECGCKTLIPCITKKGTIARFLHGHNMKGKKQTEESVKKRILKNTGKKRSKEFCENFSYFMKGKKFHYGKGKKWYIDQSGYKHIWIPEYEFADSKGFYKEHRYIYETTRKCCLLSHGIVHHINGVKLDNRKENLKGMTKSQHMSIHRMEAIAMHYVSIILHKRCN